MLIFSLSVSRKLMLLILMILVSFFDRVITIRSPVTMETLDGLPLIVTLDGECAPRTELHARVCEKNLSVLLPAGLERSRLPFVKG